MRIENFKDYKINFEDIKYLESLDDIEGFIEFNNDFIIVKIFEDLKLDSFDLKTFLKLCIASERVIRRPKDQKHFEMGIKLAYWLISIGEKELENKIENIIEEKIANLYSILGYVIYFNKDEDFSVAPYCFRRSEYGLDIDNLLAVKYLEKAHLLDPGQGDCYFVLGMHHFYLKNYEKSYKYLIKTCYYSSIDEKWIYGDTGNYINIEANIFNQLGCIFNSKYNEGNHDISEKVFVCFERAYLITKERKWENKEDTINSLYNLAFVYIKGIGVKENVKKGQKLLKELDKKLKNSICQ